MKIYNGLSGELSRKPRSVAIGIFDGVHLGHQRIISRVLLDARLHGTSPAILTFDPHPVKVLKPRQFHPTLLMSLPHRLRLFRELGIQETFVVHFNRDFSRIGHEEFLRKILLKRLKMRFLSVGHDFRFGRKGLGGKAYLEQKAKELGFRVFFVNPVTRAEEVISSTRIRRLIEKGDLGKARQMLGRPVSVYGTVVRGRGRGKGVGFPTANLNLHHEALPPGGVYAAWGFLKGKKLKGVIHIGERPTFKDKERSLEVHFLNFHKNIYNEEIELIFVKKLRGIRRFENSKELARAIRKDIQKVREVLAP